MIFLLENEVCVVEYIYNNIQDINICLYYTVAFELGIFFFI